MILNDMDIPAYAGMKAMVVEDDSGARDILVTLLKELGINDITEKMSGTDACTFLEQHDDWRGIVLCDWNMPVMTGADMYNKVKLTKPDIPFIMVTGRNDEPSVKFAKESGIYAYILKPYSLEELDRKLSKVSMVHENFLCPPIGEATTAAGNYSI